MHAYLLKIYIHVLWVFVIHQVAKKSASAKSRSHVVLSNAQETSDRTHFISPAPAQLHEPHPINSSEQLSRAPTHRACPQDHHTSSARSAQATVPRIISHSPRTGTKASTHTSSSTGPHTQRHKIHPDTSNGSEHAESTVHVVDAILNDNERLPEAETRFSEAQTGSGHDIATGMLTNPVSPGTGTARGAVEAQDHGERGDHGKEHEISKSEVLSYPQIETSLVLPVLLEECDTITVDLTFHSTATRSQTPQHSVKVVLLHPRVHYLKLLVPFFKAFIRDIGGPTYRTLFGQSAMPIYSFKVVATNLSLRFLSRDHNVVIAGSNEHEALDFACPSLSTTFTLKPWEPCPVVQYRISTPVLYTTLQLPTWHTRTIVGRKGLDQLVWSGVHINIDTAYHGMPDRAGLFDRYYRPSLDIFVCVCVCVCVCV